MFSRMKETIKSSLSSARKINFCADIWSKKGLTSSYLGVTAHYFSPGDGSIRHATLAVRSMTYPHTGLYIIIYRSSFSSITIGDAISVLMKLIIQEWEIPSEKVGYVVTDNGSNMVKAFKRVQAQVVLEDLGDEGTVIESGSGSDDADMADFEEQEVQHAVAFEQQDLVRLSCFSHTLQLVVMTFNKNDSAKELLRNAYKIVSSTNKSGKATEALVALAGKKLVAHSVTRWSTAYLVVHRLLEVQEHLQKVLYECKLAMLQPHEWEALKDVDRLLKVFATFTDICGGEMYTTLSRIVPCIFEIQQHLQVMVDVEKVSEVAQIMLGELDRRFAYIMDSTDAKFNPVYMAAALLDPRYCKLLEILGTTTSIKNYCLTLIKKQSDSSSDENNEIVIDDPDGDLSMELVSDSGGLGQEPRSKRRRGSGSFSYVRVVLKKQSREQQVAAKQSYPNLAQLQLENYLQDVGYHNESTDPIGFWLLQQSLYTVIAPFAIDLLSVPASAAPIERVFSTAGESTMGKRNRLSHVNLEREVLLRKNKMYYFYD